MESNVFFAVDDDHHLVVPKNQTNRNRSLSDPVYGTLRNGAVDEQQKFVERPKNYMVENFAIQEQVATTFYSKVKKFFISTIISANMYVTLNTV